MACYLKIAYEETTCEGCGHKTPPCMIGVTDSFRAGDLVPICDRCLRGLDPHLANIQRGVWIFGGILWRSFGHRYRPGKPDMLG
ncbi:MAG: hypothetical protein GY719_37575 [bacterium]|nr:hypothetical protein [bacterium]